MKRSLQQWINCRLCTRITRTLTPRPITSKQIHRLLSRDQTT